MSTRESTSRTIPGDTEMPSLLNSEQRTRSIVRAGLMGIAVNFVYALLKGGIGLMSGSIAIFLDALNNMSDAVTAVIAAAGARLARRPADRFHPFGHGRVEYLSSLAISVIIVVIGVMSLTSAVKKIIHPEAAHYTLLMLLIMATGVVAKLSLGIYTLRAGRRESSDSLRGAGTENLFDAFVTLATILSALILIEWGIDLDGWFGAAISLLLIRAGAKITRRTLSNILGRRAESSLTRYIKSIIASFPGVQGVYDLVLNNYGPSYMVGSVNIAVAEGMTAGAIHMLTRDIEQTIESRCGIYLNVGIYAEPSDPETLRLRSDISRIVTAHAGAMEIHGFLLDRKRGQVSFDVVTDFTVRHRCEFCHTLERELAARYPAYSFLIHADFDYSD